MGVPLLRQPFGIASLDHCYCITRSNIADYAQTPQVPSIEYAHSSFTSSHPATSPNNFVSPIPLLLQQ